MEIFNLDINRLNHASFKIKYKNKIIYFDPYEINNQEKADIILITHEHFDHCDVESLKKIINIKTIIVASVECKSKIMEFKSKISNIIYINPGGIIKIGDIKIQATASYNTNKFKLPGKVFHPKKDNKCGFIVTIDGKNIYHAGDTDIIPEMKEFPEIHIAFLPISGIYVMTPKEAAEVVDIIQPMISIPMHYGKIVGTIEDAKLFRDLIGEKSKVEII